MAGDDVVVYAPKMEGDNAALIKNKWKVMRANPFLVYLVHAGSECWHLWNLAKRKNPNDLRASRLAGRLCKLIY